MPISIYDVALELARANGWRNVTRTPLVTLARAKGLVPDTMTDKNWCKNLRGSNSLSALRSRLRLEPGIPDGTPQGERTGAWKDINRDLILDTAYKLSSQRGRLLIPRAEIAEAAGVSPATVSGMWGDMATLRLAVVDKAIADGRQNLVLQADAIGLTA